MSETKESQAQQGAVSPQKTKQQAMQRRKRQMQQAQSGGQQAQQPTGQQAGGQQGGMSGQQKQKIKEIAKRIAALPNQKAKQKLMELKQKNPQVAKIVMKLVKKIKGSQQSAGQPQQSGGQGNMAQIAKFLQSEQGQKMIGQIAMKQLSKMKGKFKEQKEELNEITESKAKLRLLAEEIIGQKKQNDNNGPFQREKTAQSKGESVPLDPSFIDRALAAMGETSSVASPQILQKLQQKSAGTGEEKQAQVRGYPQGDSGFDLGDAAIGGGIGAGGLWAGNKFFGSPGSGSTFKGQVANMADSTVPVSQVDSFDYVENVNTGQRYTPDTLDPNKGVQLNPVDGGENTPVKYLDPDNPENLDEYRLLQETDDGVNRRFLGGFDVQTGPTGDAILNPKAKNVDPLTAGLDEFLLGLRGQVEQGSVSGKNLGRSLGGGLRKMLTGLF